VGLQLRSCDAVRRDISEYQDDGGRNEQQCMDADAVEYAIGVYLADCSLFRTLPWEQAGEESIDIPGSVDSAPGGLWSLSQGHFTGAQHLQRHGNGIWYIGAYSYTAICPYDYAIEHLHLERENLVRRKEKWRHDGGNIRKRQYFFG
jgi:hypothetical protein